MKKQTTTTTKKAASTRTRKSKAQPQPVGEVVKAIVAEAKAAAEQPAETAQKKIVDVRLNATDMEAATERAQLIVTHDDKGNRYKFWLPKSQINILPDGDEPGKMVCRLAAWLYYRTGMNAVYPALRWSSVAR